MSEISEKQIKRLRSLLTEAETNLSAAKELLTSMLGDGDIITAPASTVIDSPDGKIIEGVFDGQIMIGPDGKNYPVPANYASKSKLVEGDILKLTIGESGKFMYKQIGPVERKTVIGTLTSHDDQYFVEVNGKGFRYLFPHQSRRSGYSHHPSRQRRRHLGCSRSKSIITRLLQQKAPVRITGVF